MENTMMANAIASMQHHLAAAGRYLDALAKGYRSAEKCNTLLDAAMNQVELCCLDMRNLCERSRPRPAPPKPTPVSYIRKELYGEVVQMDNGWLDIRLNALLPHCKVVGGTRYVCDTVTRLLDNYRSAGGQLPYYDKAYIAIVEHCDRTVDGAFDNDNKGFRGVINALKGRICRDDDQFELALGLFTVVDADLCCHIYVTPFEDAGDFLYQMADTML